MMKATGDGRRATGNGQRASGVRKSDEERETRNLLNFDPDHCDIVNLID